MPESDFGAGASIGEEAPDARRRIDGLPGRLLNVFLSPGRLMDQLADEPRWLGVLLLTTAISAATAAL
ncbi:MAG: hypothetical protein ACPHWZ_14075, partial [Longimicrobiales bacterium]